MFEGNCILHAAANQTLLLFPGRRHGGRRPYPSDLQFYWVHFRVHETSALHSNIRVPRVTDVQDPALLTEMFCRFISDQESGILDPVSAAHLVGLMLVEASVTDKELMPRAATRAREQAPLVQEIQAYIDRNFHEPITTSSIARDFRRSAD
jgi:hypothetical protein